MRYEYDGKAFNIPDDEIDKAMEKLDISIDEACQMYLFDHDWITDPTAEELTAKAKENRITATIHEAKGKKKERKKPIKKVNELKKQIISLIYDSFYDIMHEFEGENNTITVKNDEKYIDLTINGREFTINLVEHRKKKAKEG